MTVREVLFHRTSEGPKPVDVAPARWIWKKHGPLCSLCWLESLQSWEVAALRYDEKFSAWILDDDRRSKHAWRREVGVQRALDNDYEGRAARISGEQRCRDEAKIDLPDSPSLTWGHIVASHLASVGDGDTSWPNQLTTEAAHRRVGHTSREVDETIAKITRHDGMHEVYAHLGSIRVTNDAGNTDHPRVPGRPAHT